MMLHWPRPSHNPVDHAQNSPALSCTDVAVRYDASTPGRRPQLLPGQDWALLDLTFAIAAGSRVAVVGPNGAGKSTLFKLIIGSLRPNRGEVTVYGYDSQAHTCIAYVPQRRDVDWLFPVTVGDVVMMGRTGKIGLLRRPRRLDREMVAASLARVNAGHLVDKQIGELSGGQQQRVFIARALAQEAELLLLDEPLTGLDVPAREMIFAILDQLRAEGVTVLVATHDLHLVADHFDQVLLLNRRMIAFGTPAEVLQNENLIAAFSG